MSRAGWESRSSHVVVITALSAPTRAPTPLLSNELFNKQMNNSPASNRRMRALFLHTFSRSRQSLSCFRAILMNFSLWKRSWRWIFTMDLHGGCDQLDGWRERSEHHGEPLPPKSRQKFRLKTLIFPKLISRIPFSIQFQIQIIHSEKSEDWKGLRVLKRAPTKIRWI